MSEGGSSGWGMGWVSAQFGSLFTFENPNSTQEITVIEIAIYGQDGTSVRTIAPAEPKLAPQETRAVSIAATVPDASEAPTQFYTVEIVWSSGRDTLPPIGTVVVFQKTSFDGKNYDLAKTRVQMHSMP
jgi:hypothetical protein